MENQLPDEFDLIVVGTGMTESIISAAASRIGKTVLHIDRSDYYGGHWGSFNLKAIEYLCNKEPVEKCKVENCLSLGNNLFDIKNFEIKWHIPAKMDCINNMEQSENVEIKIENFGLESNKNMENTQPNKQERMETSNSENIEKIPIENCTLNKKKSDVFTKEILLKDARKFNIDLAPKLHYARGSFVELLISSNIARYAEYRSVSRVLTWLNGQLETVPCSRSDVFANNKVSVIEKRMLMKLLTSLDLDEQEIKNYESKTFQTFLKDRKLTPNLIHYVLYAISRSDNKTPCMQGIQNTKRFLESLGRFGKTPFLFSMYGSGETTQAFCRLSAVFGGIFALSQPLKGLTITENKISDLLSGEQCIKAQHFVLSLEKAPENFVRSLKVEEYISRAVFITDRSLMASEQEHLTLLMYPPENCKNSVTVLEMGTLTGTCSKGLFLVHLITKQQERPQQDFQHIIENLFEQNYSEPNVKLEGKPQVLWSCYFSIPNTSQIDVKSENFPENVFLCSGPDLDLDYDQCIQKAKDIFNEIYPDLEFLPRAPDPEDIIIGENTENSDKTVQVTDSDITLENQSEKENSA